MFVYGGPVYANSAVPERLEIERSNEAHLLLLPRSTPVACVQQTRPSSSSSPFSCVPELVRSVGAFLAFLA